MKFKTYTGVCRLGIDDLLGLSAYVGSWGQGDHYYSNNPNITHPDYVSFVFDCEESQKAINEELEFRKAWNEAYIKQLKESGEYGKEVEGATITLIPNPRYDFTGMPIVGNISPDSWRMEILDFGKDA